MEAQYKTSIWKKCSGTPRLEKCAGTPRLEKCAGTPRLEKCIGTPRLEKCAGTPMSYTTKLYNLDIINCTILT